MSTTIVRDMSFEAAHYLPQTPAGHKCRHMHGHSYVCEVHVTRRVDLEAGWVCDFAELRAAFEPVRAALDHRVLNEVPGLENPTSENIARWIWERLAPSLPGLSAIVVRETATARCIYTGPDA